MQLLLEPNDFKLFYDALRQWYAAKLQYVCENVFARNQADYMGGGGPRGVAGLVKTYSEQYDKAHPQPTWQELIK